jgi:SAM-dependent methyltransferase
MADQKARFDDGAAYERFMGIWSRMVGDIFLDWLAPPPGLHWIDIGCGNGAFTEQIAGRCVPAGVLGINPAPAQVEYALGRPVARIAEFRQGDAMALPLADNSVDAAVMALVIGFIPDPAKGVDEMVRVVRPGGLVAAYFWDMPGGGSPMEVIDREMRALGRKGSRALNPGASRISALRDLWDGAGIRAVETRGITVRRTFDSFDDYWTTTIVGSLFKHSVAEMPPDEVDVVKNRMREKLPPDAAGRVTCKAWANAVKGRVPA